MYTPIDSETIATGNRYRFTVRAIPGGTITTITVDILGAARDYVEYRAAFAFSWECTPVAPYVGSMGRDEMGKWLNAACAHPVEVAQ